VIVIQAEDCARKVRDHLLEMGKSVHRLDGKGSGVAPANPDVKINGQRLAIFFAAG